MAQKQTVGDEHAHHMRQRSSSMSHVSSRSSPAVPPHRRFDGLFPTPSYSSDLLCQLIKTESWVEVASQPSSSSLSSIGDEIVTTGLHVTQPYIRRRRLQPSARSIPQRRAAAQSVGAISQEEYDESGSEEEHLLKSSTENVVQSPPEEAMEDSDADSDDGDNATALGRVSDEPVFRPQPNAFSHPPSNMIHRSHSTNSSMPPHPHSGFTRPSFSQRSQTRVHHRGPSFMSPNMREDNDAALRASLTTLLSCAAAARGLPKSQEEAEAQRAASRGVGPSDQPMDLRLVPESELMKEPEGGRQVSPPSQRKRNTAARSPSRADMSLDSCKRSPSAGRSPRALKKKKTTAAVDEALISPTMFTWMVSAGVVVLVSVVGFGAGYVIGREVGRQEGFAASVGGVNETTSAGREAMRSSGSGLRRMRWGAVGKTLVAQA